MTVYGESNPIGDGYWINFIPNINISINDIIDKITPFLGIWEVSSNDPFPDTLSDTRVFIRELSENNLHLITSEWYAVYKRNIEVSNNQDMLRMFHSYWIFSIESLLYIKDNYTPYYNQLFRSFNFRQQLRDSPDSSSVTLVLFDNFATTILDVSENTINYHSFDRLFNFNEEVSNNSITSSDLSINNIFALFIQDNVTDIDITNFYQSSILQSNNIPIKSIHLPNLRVLYFDEDSKCKTISKNSFNSSLGNLQQLILPDRIQTIDNFAFRNSGKLNFVLIPNSITTLGEGCFQDCTSLRIINFDNLRNIWTISGSNFFIHGISLEQVFSINANSLFTQSHMDILNNDSKFLIHISGYDNPKEFLLSNNYIIETEFSNLKIIPKNFCKGNIRLNSCILPRSVTDICDNAFENCENLIYFEFSLMDNIAYIGEAAFRGSGIKRISRAEDTAFFVGAGYTSTNRDISLSDIGIEAFANCHRLQIANLSSFSNLRGLSERLFLDCSSLISVYLPPSVERIRESAFKGCSSLRYLSYNLTNSLFEDMRIQVAFFNASTSSANNDSTFNKI